MSRDLNSAMILGLIQKSLMSSLSFSKITYIQAYLPLVYVKLNLAVME